jgi:hypothetical protein
VLRIKENKGMERRMERIGRDKRKVRKRDEEKKRKRRKIDTREYRDAGRHA